MSPLAERNAIVLTAFLDSLGAVTPHSLWEQYLCAGCLCVPRAHMWGWCAAGECEGIPCFSGVTQFPALFPSICLCGILTAC